MVLDIADRLVVGDLVYVLLRVVIEYEGAHHQEDREQYLSDIDRYKVMRDHRYRYLQVTKERIDQPRAMVKLVHREMCEAGYDGPPPVFGETWRVLFARLSTVVGARRLPVA